MDADSFNLPAPFGFRGLHPDVPVRRYQRRLPHWRQHGATYFVTFRLADSIPQEHLLSLKRWRELWEQSHPPPRDEKEWRRMAKEITSRTEAWLDEGYGDCVFKDPEIANEMAQSLVHFQDRHYLTSCFCIMHNHVHLIIKPLNGFELEGILEGIKGYVSRAVNQRTQRSGQLWAQESYDRIIRDAEHLYQVVQYIGRNPAKAGYPRETWVRWVHPDWEAQGWGFID
jgi:REP element-mobilizing transposase RayT